MGLITQIITHYSISSSSVFHVAVDFHEVNAGSPVKKSYKPIAQLAEYLGLRLLAPLPATGWPRAEVGPQAVDCPPKTPISVTRVEHSHYYKEIKPGVVVDVYNVCDAFKMPAAVDHAVKKLLASGDRGYKDQRQDIEEAIKSLRRQLEIIDEWA